MKRILLTRGKFTVVDDEDFEKTKKITWYFSYAKVKTKIDCGGYAKGYNPQTGKNVFLHRFILNIPSNIQVDHVNHDKLDNRRCNLRLATRSQNNMNREKTNNKHGYKGISFYSHRKYYTKTTSRLTYPKSWRANIKINKRRISLGFFCTKGEAAQAYNEAAKRYFGEYAFLNKL
jgi:hypothetical protein